MKYKGKGWELPHVRYRLVEYLDGNGESVWRVQHKRRFWPVWSHLESEHVKYRRKEHAVDEIDSRISRYLRNNLTVQEYVYGPDEL